jgi:hypothetical protein
MPNRTFYGIIHKLGIWITPIVLIIFSLSLNLPNNTLHKATLRNSNFYNQLSSEINTNSLDLESAKSSFSGILFSSVLKDLATPGWLQNLFERNIDLSSNWISGKTENLTLYLPSEDIQQATSKNIDNQTKKITSDFADQIKVCSKNEEEVIKREGFDLDQKDFCLPESVAKGQQQLTEFLGVKSTDSKQSILDKVVKNNQLKVSTEKFNAEDLLTNSNQKNLISRLNFFRDLFLRLSAIAPFAMIFCFILLIIDLFLAKSMNRRIGKELRKYLFYVASSTISLAALIILGLGASTYFTSFIRNLLFPGGATTRIINLLALEIVKFSFNITSAAVWISVGFLVFNLIYQFLENSGILHNPEAKNSRLMRKPAIATSAHNSTLDGQFHKERRPKIDFEKEDGFYSQNSEDINFSTPQTPSQSQMNQNFNNDYYQMQKLQNVDAEMEVLQNLDDQRSHQNSLLAEDSSFSNQFPQNLENNQNSYNSDFQDIKERQNSNLNQRSQTQNQMQNKSKESTERSNWTENFEQNLDATQSPNPNQFTDQEMQRYIQSELEKSQFSGNSNNNRSTSQNTYYQDFQDEPPAHIGSTTRPDDTQEYRDFELNLKKPRRPPPNF